MAEDTRTFIDKSLSRSVSLTGSEITPDELAKEFAKRDFFERVEHLESLAADNEEYSSVEEAAKQHAYRSALRSMHERLRKVGR